MSTPKTPGVYLKEVNAFPNSVVGVPTAVPAFIGYTPRASYEGESYHMRPVPISSMAEFNAFFAYEDPAPPAGPAQQYKPHYHLTNHKDKKPEKGKAFMLNGDYFTLEPDPGTMYYLYNSIRLFFENGGGDAYVVSVGTYGAPTGKAIEPGALPVNPYVQLGELQKGIEILQKVPEPTIYVVPEATLLDQANNQTLMQGMLLQAGEMESFVCLFDIIGGIDPDPILYKNDIQSFRESTGSENLKYGISYYPFLDTTITQNNEVDYTNLNGGDIASLADILNPAGAPNPSAAKIIGDIEKPPENPLTSTQYNQALLIASKTYGQIMKQLLNRVNILPPSSAMAGIYNQVDSTDGVWSAPANLSPIGVTDITIRLNDKDQENMNVDAFTGKSVNAIRFFTGQGVLIWGARTLDGNSQDWRYIQVRRTATFIEQSLKIAARSYVFADNTANTWVTVKAEFDNFLNNLWRQGGLMGSTPAAAYDVQVGLGKTMTPQDILDGFMRISVKVAMIRPAEFIVITFSQKMPS